MLKLWPFNRKRTSRHPQVPLGKRVVASLLDEMEDGREYHSLVDCIPHNLNIRDEIRRGIGEIERVRGRPLLLYAGNIATSQPHPFISVNNADELPFAEMVDAVDVSDDSVDMLVVTGGGSAQTVSSFVDNLRDRFQNVSFIIPSMCMSAGTILVLSGDEIWMDERAYIGPIDPQIPNRDGTRYVPMLAIWTLVNMIQEEGKKALDAGGQPDWSHLQLLRNMDPKDLGDALSASDYATKQVKEYLQRFKFRNWTLREGTGIAVDDTYREQRAEQIAAQLCDHTLWKMHSHRIPRDAAEAILRLKIMRLESIPGFERAVRRLWALLYYVFENSQYLKIIVSQDYALFRARPSAPGGT